MFWFVLFDGYLEPPKSTDLIHVPHIQRGWLSFCVFVLFCFFSLGVYSPFWDISSISTALSRPFFANSVLCFTSARILNVCLVNIPWNQNDLLSGFLCFWSCCRMVCFPNDAESLVKFRKQDIRISQLTQFMDIIKRSLLPSAVKARQGETQCCKVIMTK